MCYSRKLMEEVVQSVNIMIGILMGGVSWSIYYIMRMAYLESNDGTQPRNEDSNSGSESGTHDGSRQGIDT